MAAISLHPGNPRWVPPRPSHPGADGLRKLVFNQFPDCGQRPDCPAGRPVNLLAPRVSQQAHPRAPSGPGRLTRHCRTRPWWTRGTGKNRSGGSPSGVERWQALINPRAASREASCPLTAASELKLRKPGQRNRETWAAGLGCGERGGAAPTLGAGAASRQPTGNMGSVQKSSVWLQECNCGPASLLDALRGGSVGA